MSNLIALKWNLWILNNMNHNQKFFNDKLDSPIFDSPNELRFHEYNK
jgi:hypothetical protein